MKDKLKKEIEEKYGSAGFIKVTDAPLSGLSSEQKVQLNRKGNELFNAGNIEGARKIFQATGYSDGLSRIGTAYERQNRPLDALREYRLAHNQNKAEPMYELAAKTLRQLLRADDTD